MSQQIPAEHEPSASRSEGNLNVDSAFDTHLPIAAALPQLLTTLEAHNRCVLVAPPGSGKSSQVPLALRQCAWLQRKKILVLEPRRIAARAIAERLSFHLNETVGNHVGYRIRDDRMIAKHTQIEVITEGILTRMLQHDPALETVGAVIFDEFHERSLHVDLGLALTIQAQTLLRQDLRVVVMSATLDATRIAELLHANTITADGRQFPVQVYWSARPDPRGRLVAVTATIRKACASQNGDVLVFLPGAPEIHRVAEMLNDGNQDASVIPLYGDLPFAEQQRVFSQTTSGRRIVLATDIAQTSITIPGIRVVIDLGLMRKPTFHPGSGFSRLETLNVSRASAEQRAGRAGRTAAGVCYRLWSEQEHYQLQAFDTPEIQRTDLSSLALELACWGCDNPSELTWLDPPASAGMASARDLLFRLDAIDENGRVTAAGRRMADLGLHPRLAHMMLTAPPAAQGLACTLATLLSERDLLRTPERGCDVRKRLAALHRNDPQAARQRRLIDQLQRRLRISTTSITEERAGEVLALAFPDRIGQLRAGSRHRYLLANGRGAQLKDQDALAGSPYLVVAELDGDKNDAVIQLAAPIDITELERYAHAEVVVEWDHQEQAVLAQRQEKTGSIVIRATKLTQVPEGRIQEKLCEGIRSLGLGVLPWGDTTHNLVQRLVFLRANQGGYWPDYSDEALLTELEQWLAPYLLGLSRRSHLTQIPLLAALLDRLTAQQRRELDHLAPTHINVPSGSSVALDYSDRPRVLLAVRLQEVFGWQQTPVLPHTMVPITLQLLSPARRPIQVTQDLSSFWRNGYTEVRKELRARYPKHSWPEDPFTATAVRGTVKRRS